MEEQQKQKTTLSAASIRSYMYFLQRNSGFRRLWLAGVISHLGNWFNYVALFVLMDKLTGSGQAVSYFLMAKFIPTTILGPAAGVIADRFSRKFILVASNICRFFIVLGYLFVDRPDRVWMIYFLALLQEAMWTFSNPARQASVPNLCAKEELNLANGLDGATWSVMLAFGAASGGFVTSMFGWRTAIIIDAFTFAIAAWMLLKLPLPDRPPEAPKPLSWRRISGIDDLQAGLRFVRRDSWVRSLLFVKSGWALSGGILVMLAVFGEQVLVVGGEGRGSGILYSFRGLGAAIGPLLAWKLWGEEKAAMSRAIGYGFFISSLAYLFFSQATSLLAAVPFVLCGHIGGSIQWVFSTTLLQRSVPDAFRGRVFSAEMALLTFCLSLSTYWTGIALDAGYSPRHIVILLALLFLVPGTLWSWRYRRSALRN